MSLAPLCKPGGFCGVLTASSRFVAAGTKSPPPPYYGEGAYRPADGAARDARRVGDAMYSVVYWTGMTTLILWSAYSAYSAIIGL
jgi:hypothetical protein